LEVLDNATMRVYESQGGITLPQGREIKRFAYNARAKAA
jgi:hypothetical protein